MVKGAVNKCMLVGILAIGLLCFPNLTNSKEPTSGNIIGFVYAEDGTTPFEGAVIKAKNISSGDIYTSSPSDSRGMFTVANLKSGIYLYGVVTGTGDYNSDGLIGVKIRNNETAKVSIILTPYEKKVYSALHEIYEEQRIDGESFVGKVVDFDPVGNHADVYIMKGVLQVEDRIHAKGIETNFYQNVDDLKHKGVSVKKMYSGDTASLKFKHSANIGDSVYLVCKNGLLPMFMTPVGIATMVAGSSAVIYKVVDLQDDPKDVSPARQ